MYWSLSLSALNLKTFTAVALADLSIQEAAAANNLIRKLGVKTVYCRVYGTSGVVFADFLDSVQDLNPLGTRGQKVC